MGTTSLQWQNIYVFISSTFNDMHAERDYLVKRVFPDLREWCEQRKLRLIDIDLRWGVTEADAAGKRALKVCLRRINDCRPFFLCFLGQRHGWIPGKGGISPDTFDEFPNLEQELLQYPAASITELEIRHAVFRPLTWRDPENAAKKPVPYRPAEHAFFYLREADYVENLKNAPRQLLCIYTDDVGPNDETIEEEAHRLASREALSALSREITASDRMPHQPIRYTADWNEDLRTPELAMPLECPHREPDNIRRWFTTWNRFAGVEINNPEFGIPETKRNQAVEYNAVLTKGRLSGFRCAEHTRRRFPPGTDLALLIKLDLQQAILERHPDRKELAQTTDLQRELDQHEEFIANSVEGFVMRAGDFDELNDYANSHSTQLFVLTSASGMGKSTLLGKWIDTYRRQIENQADHSIHARFIAQSDGSTTVDSLLRFLLREIKEVQHKLDADIPENPLELRRAWPELLREIARRGKTVIVIDGLNQLASGLSDLTWLPRPMPPGLKMIVSFKLDEPSSELYNRMQSDPHLRFGQVKPFADKKDREALVERYLNQYWKDLDAPLLDALITSPGAINPLYLKVVLSELRTFGAFANLNEKIQKDFGDTPVSAFHAILRRLETDPAYTTLDPKQAVPLLFGLLAHARKGLSIDELTGILIQSMKLSDTQETRQDVADTLHLYIRQVRAFLARREGRYDYFYESFKSASLERYEKGIADSSLRHSSAEWHRFLCNYFEGLPTWKERPSGLKHGRPVKRKVSELAYHLTLAEEWARLEASLCSLDFIEAKCTARLAHDLIEDFLFASSQPRIPEAVARRLKDFQLFVQEHANALSWFPRLTFQQAVNESDQSGPAEAAWDAVAQGVEKRPWLEWINKPQSRNPCMLTLVGHSTNITCVAFSPDGRKIISSSEEGLLKLWDARTGAELVTLEGHAGAATACTFSDDGKYIASGSADHSILIRDAETGTVLKQIRIKTSPAAIYFSPDGGQLAAFGAVDDMVRIWNTSSGKLIAKLRRSRSGDVHACLFAADSNSVLAVYSDNSLSVWDYHKLQETASARSPGAFPTCCTISRNGSLVASGMIRDHSVSVWNSRTGEIVASLKGHANTVKACAFSPDNRRLVSAGADNTVRVWDVTTGEPVALFTGHLWPPTACSFSPDGKRIITASLDQTIKIWDAESAGFIEQRKHAAWVHACAFSPDGSKAVSASADKTLKIWDGHTGKELATLSGHSGWVSACAFSPDGKRIVSGSWDNTLKLWDSERHKELQTMTGHQLAVNCCAFSPDGRTIASGSGDTTVMLWNSKNGNHLQRLEAHDRHVAACAFSPEGSRLLSASGDTTLRIWNPAARDAKAVLRGHTSAVNTCAFSPDASKIISGSSDTNVMIWNASSGEPLFKLGGHTGYVGSCSFSPDGKYILSASSDQTLLIRDADTCEILLLYFFPGLAIASFSPDGTRIVSAGQSGIVQLLALRNLNIAPPVVTAWQQPAGLNPFAKKRFGMRCPSCGKWSELESKSVGTELECPFCRNRMRTNKITVTADWLLS